MSETRDKFVETTSRLLETQGYHATGLNQIVRESGAPKGSLYYHFPGGKEELAAEAIHRTGRSLANLIEANFREDLPLPEAVREFVTGVARGIEAESFSAGGPLTAVAMETVTASERLNLACREAFARIQTAFSGKLALHGLNSERAVQLATFITSAIEGGIILSRTQHSGDPLRQVADLLYEVLPA